MYEFQSYVIFTPLLRFFFFLIHMHVHLNSSRDPSCQAQIKNMQSKIIIQVIDQKQLKKKYALLVLWYG